MIDFWATVQGQLAKNDIDGFLSHVEFPLIINDCNLPGSIDEGIALRHCRTVADATDFKRDLEHNLPESMRQAFLHADPTKLFCNYLGSAFDNGTFVAWAWPPQSNTDPTEMRIFALNLPEARIPGWR